MLRVARGCASEPENKTFGSVKKKKKERQLRFLYKKLMIYDFCEVWSGVAYQDAKEAG